MASKADFENNFEDEMSEEPELEMTAQLKDQQMKHEEELDKNEAYRTKGNGFVEMHWGNHHLVFQDVIRSLNGLTKTRIQHFYPQ